MPAIAPNIRQRLLCRSDLHAMEVDGERIAQWLRNEQLTFLGHVDAEDLPGGDAVYATDDDTVHAELLTLLTQHGRDGVALATTEARTLLEGETNGPGAHAEAKQPKVAAGASNPADMISEHVVQEGLDEAIDEITEAIDNLLVSTNNAPLDLRDDAPLHEAAQDADGNDVVEVEPAQVETTIDEDILVEIGPEEVEAASAQALHDWTADQRATTGARSGPATTHTDVRVVLDAQPVAEALQQILAAVRALGERQLPQTDLAPVTESIQKGVRALQATVAKATNRTETDERLDRIHDALLEAVDVVRGLGDMGTRRKAARAARNSRKAAASAAPRFSLTNARENAGAVLAAASTMVGWSAAAWLYATDGKLALGALVCANLVACAALLARKPDAK